MAEENQDKFTLPIAGVATLLALAGAVIFYQSPLKTSRPIDQEAERKAPVKHERVQSRLWQDPFEAVQTHQLKELEHQKVEKADEGKKLQPISQLLFKKLIENIKAAGGSATFRILPVFVDGSPYASGIESRLKDRYAVVSALGGAGYMPESGEYIRYFEWPESSESKTRSQIIIPVERFIPKAKIRESKPEDVLILWLKDQDFSESKPLELMSELVGYLKDAIWRTDTKFLQARYLQVPGGEAKESPGYKKRCDYKSESISSQNFHISTGWRDVIYPYWSTGDNNLIFDCLYDELNNKFKFGIINNKTSYAILGPRYSGTLSAMLKELPHYKAACDGDNNVGASLHESTSIRKDFKIYSNASTADENFIFDCLPDGKHGPETSMQTLFKAIDIGFIRTIETEAILAEQLVKELKRRRVDLTSGNANEDSIKADKDSGNANGNSEKNHKDSEKTHKECEPYIALVSEWDTLYGRALPRTFAAVAQSMVKHGEGLEGDEKLDHDKLASNIDKLRKDDWPPWITRYSYMAGLDGELPPKKEGNEAGKTKDKTKEADNKSRAVQEMEKAAEGRDQLDYLQRLTMDLKMIEDGFSDEPPRNCNGKLTLSGQKRSFKAIGVLGSDVYDKLLILQALKKEFPQAIFFTTNLDARMMHPEQREWTRNLIVASHFGLQLHLDLQNPIPPFRDSSQTALFYSVFQALGHLKRVKESIEKPTHLELTGGASRCSIPSDSDPTGMSEKYGCFSAEIKPKLYEIGRNTAVDISPDLQSPEEFKSIHAPRPDVNRGKVRPLVTVETIIWVVVALFFLGIGARLISHEVDDLIKKKIFRIVMTATVAFGIVLVIWARSDRTKGEPFVLTQGVSVWPAVAIQLLAIYLCIGFYFYARNLLNIHDDVLRKKFASPRPKATHSLGGWFRWWLYPPYRKTYRQANHTDSKIASMKVFDFDFFMERCFSIPQWHKSDNETSISKHFPCLQPKAPASILGWLRKFQQWLFPRKTHDQAEDKLNIIELWKEYRERRGLRYSLFRLIPQLFFFSLFGVIWYLKIGFPPVPCRGEACFHIYNGTMLVSWFLMALLMLYVIDTTRLCRRFVSILCEKKFPWPEIAQSGNDARYPAIQKSYLNEFYCIELIGEWTAVVSKLLYFPFIILFLLTAARYNYIDNFDWPIWLAAIYGIIAAYAVGVVVALRVTAEKARKRAIEQIEKKLNDESSRRLNWPPSRKERKRQIEEVIQRIRDNREGAFLPFYQYPILGALAVPAGGTGILYLIDYLVQSF